METTISPPLAISPNLPTEYQIQNFKDVRCLLANLYHYSVNERKHLKTKKGYTSATQASYDPEQLNQIQFYLVAMMVKFQEKQWRDIDLTHTPKLPDIYIIQLQRHELFEGQPVETYTKDIRLIAREKKVLKELALRLAP